MQSDEIRVVDVDVSNIDDLLSVCSFKKLDDPLHRIGMELKKKWVQDMLRRYGACAKIAYLNGIPCGQILHYAEKLDSLAEVPRESAVRIECIFTSRPEARRRGVAKALLNHLLRDLGQPMACFGGRPCCFVLTDAFDTGEVFSQRRFFEHMRFKQATDDSRTLYYPIAGNYVSMKNARPCGPCLQDKGRAVLLYSPTCQFSYEFVVKAEAMIRAVDPKLPIRLVNEWKHPSEAIQRRGEKIVVNAVRIRSFFLGEDKFKRDVERALGTL